MLTLSSETFNTTVSGALGFLEDPYVSTIVSTALAVFGGVIAPKLPGSILELLGKPVVKLALIFLIAYMSTKNPMLAVVSSIAVVFSVQAFNRYELEKRVDEVQSEQSNVAIVAANVAAEEAANIVANANANMMANANAVVAMANGNAVISPNSVAGVINAGNAAVDSTGNVIDEEGNLVTDSNGEVANVNSNVAVTDGGNVVDTNGNVAKTSNGEPVVLVNGNVNANSMDGLVVPPAFQAPSANSNMASPYQVASCPKGEHCDVYNDVPMLGPQMGMAPMGMQAGGVGSAMPL
jgi:hypothetical protein